MTTINWLEVVGYVVIIFALFPFVAHALAKVGWFFTLLESGDIEFVMYGETLHKIIYDVRGFELVDNELIPTATQQKRPWLGLYWVGIPPFASIHRFPIVKERENPVGETPEQWIDRDEEEKLVSSLRFTFPRPYVLRSVELGDRTPVDVLIIAKFEVVNPYIPVFNFKGKFFENAGGMIRAAVNDILKRFSLDEFIAAEKGEVGGILSGMKDPSGVFNQELIRQVGLRLVGISIPKYDPSDRAVREAMNAQVIAQEEAKAVGVRAEANASAQERLAVARGAQIRETVKALTTSGGNPDVIARGAADVLEMEAAAGESSKITMVVKGGTPLVIPVGDRTGDKK